MTLPIKVVAIAPTPFFSDRGRHVHILEQVRALQKTGIDISLITYGRGEDVPGIKTKRTWNFPWYRKVTSGPSWHKFYMDFFLFFTALKAAYQEKPDIIHTYTHEGCLIGAIICGIYKIPLVFDHQGSMTKELIAHNFILTKDKLWKRMWFKIEKWINKQADAILTQSKKTKEDLMEKSAIPVSDITVIYDAVDINHFKPQNKNAELMKRYQISNDNHVVIFLGSLYPHQGIDTLLHSWKSVKNRVRQAVLIVMGYPNVHHYKKMAKDLGIIHSVHFTGRIKYIKAPRYLSLGDIAVSPKISEVEDNIKIYNYMAMGLPTVAYDTSVNRNILKDLGVYVKDAQNPQALADAIVNLLKDRRRHKISARLRQKVTNERSWASVAAQIRHVYVKLLK